MRETMPEGRQETPRNGALSGQETPSWPAAEGAQFFLGSPDSRVKEAASLVCQAVKLAQQSREYGFTLGTVATLVHKETPYVSKCLDPDDPHAAVLMLLAAMLLDRDNVVLGRLAQMKGCGLVELQRLTDEEFRRRVEAAARNDEVGSVWLKRAIGERKP